MSKTTKVDYSDWWLRDKLKSIVDRNVKSIPYEGDEVDKDGIVDGILYFFKENHYSILKHEK